MHKGKKKGAELKNLEAHLPFLKNILRVEIRNIRLNTS